MPVDPLLRGRTVDAEHFLLRVSLKAEADLDRAAYPFAIPAVRDIEQIEFHPRVTFLVGENGSGKSTIIEALAVLSGMNPEGGTQNFAFSTRASHSPLSNALRPVRGIRRPRNRFFLRAESYFNLATTIEELDREPGGPPIIDSYGGVSLHEQSHGESFMALMRHRFGANGLYILDEPEAALSPARQLEMLVRLDELAHEGCQFIIATHSPMLMAYPDAAIYELSADGIACVALEETEHYRLTLDFLRDPKRRLQRLLGR